MTAPGIVIEVHCERCGGLLGFGTVERFIGGSIPLDQEHKCPPELPTVQRNFYDYFLPHSEDDLDIDVKFHKENDDGDDS